MRTHCKADGCNNPIEPSALPGARSVYCISCDRSSARERMRQLRIRKALKRADDSYYKTKSGDVYIIYNPSFPGWVKVGCALSAEDRLRAFQTATPHRNFTLKWNKTADDKLEMERQCHNALEKYFTRKGEWFQTQPWKARQILEKLWQN